MHIHPKIRKAGFVLMAALALLASGCSLVPEAGETAGLARSAQGQIGSQRIVGYMPDWQGDINAINYDQLTHLCYAFLQANPDGSLDTSGVNPGKLQQVVRDAHAKGVKVLISLGGWNNSPAISQAMANSTSMMNLAQNSLNFVSQYQLDGFDFDWEGPASAAEGRAWEQFMKKMHDSLAPLGKETTSAIAMWYGDNIPSSAMGYMDFANLMAYDNDGTAHSTYDYGVQNVNYWVGRGIPRNKCVLGVPFYGYDSSRGAYPFSQILANDPNAWNSDYSNGIGYNGIPTIKKKAAYSRDTGAGGIMIWELSQDASGSKSLLTAIYDELRGGVVVPDTYTLTATAGNGGSISPSGSMTVTKGSSKTFTITAQAGFHISGVTVNGASVGTPSSYTLSNIQANASISASFSADTNGDCSYPPFDPAKVYLKGDRVHLGGHDWEAQWWTQGTNPGTTGEWGVWRDLGACTDVVIPGTFTITASAGSGGSISPSGQSTVSKGGSKSYTISPANGYVLADLQVNGTSVGLTSSYTFSNVQANATITATFKPTDIGASTWQSGQSYALGDVVTYGGFSWRCAYAHTSNEAWVPGTPGLWFWEKI